MQTQHKYDDKTIVDAFAASIEADHAKVSHHLQEAVDLIYNMEATLMRGQKLHEVINHADGNPVKVMVERAKQNRLVLNALMFSRGNFEFDYMKDLQAAIDAVDELDSELLMRKASGLFPDETPKVKNIRRMR